MGDLEPITRNEKLWSGEDLTPVTRREMYIKHLYDETQVIPEYPVTREEMFILKAGEELHDVTIEQLNVSENGTYSESGKAYSPVIVDVPLPENAYLLKEIEDVEIASFNDGSDLPMPKLEVAIEPVQDLHGYDAPWVGGAGKNLLNFNPTDQTQNGVTIKKNSDGSFTLNGTANALTIFQVSGVGITLDAGTYTFSGVSGGSASTSYWFELNNPTGTTPISKTFTDPTTFTLTENSSWRTVYFACRANTAFSNMTIKPMLELGSTATTFEPYYNICPISGWDEVNVTVADDVETPTVSNVYTIDLDGTRYGGKVDLVSGVMTVDRVGINMSTLTWQGNVAANHYYATLNSTPYDKTRGNEIICSCYKNEGASISAPYYGSNGSFKWWGKTDASYEIYVDDETEYASVDAFKTAISGQTLCYPLETPITIQLTPTVVKSLRGRNNVFADSGNILDLSYLAKEE